MPSTDTKPWYTSKTLIVNALALVALFIDPVGLTFSTEEQMAALAVVNMVLRWITKDGVK